jgi:hypothetical protein
VPETISPEPAPEPVESAPAEPPPPTEAEPPPPAEAAEPVEPLEAQPEPAAEAPATAEAEAAPDADAVAQTVAERLSEDESLRGDLTDDGFSPVLNWAIDLATTAATRLPDADALSAGIRGLVRGLVQAAESGDATPLKDALLPPLFTAEHVEELGRAVEQAVGETTSPDERAQQLVQALSAAPTEGS